jgi:hypothetical protein
MTSRNNSTLKIKPVIIFFDHPLPVEDYALKRQQRKGTPANTLTYEALKTTKSTRR